MNLEDLTLSEISQPRREIWYLRLSKIIEKEGRMVVARGGDNGELSFNGYLDDTLIAAS